MSGAAVVGSAVIGAGASYASSRKAGKAADAQTAAAREAAGLQYDISIEQLEFEKQQYADWENIFGPIQQNLRNYYQNLNPDTYSSLGIQSIEQQYLQSRQNLDTALAKRGITNSGATAAGLTQLETARMLGKAEVVANAPSKVAAQQANFLSIGMGQQAQLQAGISNAYSNQMNLLGQQSTNALNQANVYTQQAAAGYAGIGSSIGQGLNSYMMYNALNPTTASTSQSWLVNNPSVASGAIAY